MYHEIQKVVSITTRNNIKLVPLTCGYVEQMARGIGMSPEKTATISAVTQAILNRRMTYAFQGIGEITLDIFVGLDRLVLEIADKGMPYWLDIEKELEIYPQKADQYSIKKLGREGQRLSMCFYLEPDIDILAFKKQDDVEETLLDDDLRVYRVTDTDKDINEVMKCIYYNYGYEYPNPLIYEPAQMKALLAEGRQRSYLALNDHQQVLAHGALSFHGEYPGVPEVSGLVSKQFCRGHNVMGRLVDGMCQAAAAEEGLSGLFAIPVAFHPFSQKIFNRQGFVATGVLAHYVPSKRVGAYGDGDRRMDAFLCAKLFRPAGVKSLSVPTKHQDMVAKLYRQLGQDCVMVPPEALGGETAYDVEYIHDMALVEMKVDHAGETFAEDLDHMMLDFYRNGIELVKLCLNMSHPSAALAYDLLEKKGFFFAGILPGSASGEYMILMHLMELPMAWDKVVAVDGYQELLDYVREHAQG